MSAVASFMISRCVLQALVKVALCRRMLHPNIVPVLGVAEYPTTKDMLLVRMGLLFDTRHSFPLHHSIDCMHICFELCSNMIT